jgi:hypothetical protein
MGEWQPIETAPETGYGISDPVLLWSSQLGIVSGSLGNFKGFRWANVSCYHGNAIENWGVTHWMPLPEPPTEEASK